MNTLESREFNEIVRRIKALSAESQRDLLMLMTGALTERMPGFIPSTLDDLEDREQTRRLARASIRANLPVQP